MTQKQYTDTCVAVQADADSDRETGAADRNSPEKQCVEAVPDYQTTRLPHYHINSLPTIPHYHNTSLPISHQDKITPRQYLRNSIPRCTLLCLVEITCVYVCYDNYFLISSTIVSNFNIQPCLKCSIWQCYTVLYEIYISTV